MSALSASILLLAADATPRIWFTVGGYQVRDDDLWIVGTAILCCVSCGILGCFLVLRRMALLGDAISHAILPGLALAFILTNSREPLAMLGGALVVGVATAFLSTALQRWGRVQADAAMGVVFTTLFALGVVMITWVARNVDLDPGCVLYGLIEFTPFDTVSIGGVEIPRAFAWLFVVLAVNAGLIALFFKELKIVCFDPQLATSMGISATVVHYGLMTAVAGTAVASFESVGSILVIAMLVAPGATAHLLTDRLSRMIWIAAGLATIAAIAGYALAVWIDTSVAGMIATVSLAMFTIALLVAPRYGIVAKQVRRLALAARIAQEDALSLVYRWHERTLRLERRVASDGNPGSTNGASPLGTPYTRAASGRAPPPLTTGDVITATHSGWLGRLAVRRLLSGGLIQRGADGAISATPEGLARAARIVRGHRLWESFLATHLQLPPDHVHAGAHRAEHFLSDEIREQLDAAAGGDLDPHGRPIPPPG